jgi:hypothetical protein
MTNVSKDMSGIAHLHIGLIFLLTISPTTNLLADNSQKLTPPLTTQSVDKKSVQKRISNLTIKRIPVYFFEFEHPKTSDQHISDKDLRRESSWFNMLHDLHIYVDDLKAQTKDKKGNALTDIAGGVLHMAQLHAHIMIQILSKNTSPHTRNSYLCSLLDHKDIQSISWLKTNLNLVYEKTSFFARSSLHLIKILQAICQTIERNIEQLRDKHIKMCLQMTRAKFPNRESAPKNPQQQKLKKDIAESLKTISQNQAISAQATIKAGNNAAAQEQERTNRALNSIAQVEAAIALAQKTDKKGTVLEE